jgi:outer membrane protein OmpA-like peptidoglycan-associated protein
MAQDVSKLKELLFESESRALSDLSQRMDLVFERAGSHERFTASVAGVLDDALRQAEVDRHTELSQAIAPLIVKTIKTEIRGSQDELAEALSPAMGRMVKAYVGSAIRDLMDDINRRLESNAFMLRVRSVLTGRPVAELAFAEGQRLAIDEIFLVRRGSGALVGHWPRDATSAHDRRVSGILTAINEVATEAFEADQAALRRIDMGSSLVYLRASPTYLLAAKCRGAAPASVEQTIDEHFVGSIERLRTLLNGSADGSAPERAVNALLADLAAKLEQGIAEQQEKFAVRRGGLSPAGVLLWSIGLLLAGWAGWSAYSGYATGVARATAERVIAGQRELNGYPVHVAVEHRGSEIAMLGLVPTADAASEAVRRLHAALPLAQIVDHTAALPGGLKEARADIDALQGKVSELASDTSRRDAALKSGIGALQAALAKADTARQADLDALRAELARAVAPSARARLDAWAHTHAIFFTKDTGYRDQRAATAALDELTRLVKETDALVRVVGFTDEKGGQERNVPLSQARAERIVSELKSRGVPASRLVAVGRNNIEDLSPVVGDASPNRRAEFEIGFEGEAPR